MFLDFARDVLGDGTAILERANYLIAAPPTTLETIGFYGLVNTPALELSLRAIIISLNNQF